MPGFNNQLIFSKFLFVAVLFGCTTNNQPDSAATSSISADTSFIKPASVTTNVDTAEAAQIKLLTENPTVHPDSIVAFAKTLIGVPYLYASTDPDQGFDCSGFITYVFNHFGIKVPRSSVDFTNYGKEMTRETARPGDLILFTGTDSTIRVVGHMGIVENNEGETLSFIHSTSGKAKGVVITPLERYYMSRFVKIIRIFPDDFYE